MLTKLELSIKTFTFFSAAANALGIGAASFWSVSGKRYSGKPDGVAGTPSFLKFIV